MVKGKWVEKEWLTMTGMVTDALIDGQEIILASFKGTDGSFQDAAILSPKMEWGNMPDLQRASSDPRKT